MSDIRSHMRVHLFLLLLATATSAGSANGAPLPRLAETSLFTDLVRNCHAVNLQSWEHPTLKVLREHNVGVKKAQLCNANKYLIFYVQFPYDPQGQTKDYFLPLYQQIRGANGSRPLSFVSINDNEIVNLEFTGVKKLRIGYEMYVD